MSRSQMQLSVPTVRPRSPDSEIQSLGTVCRHTPIHTSNGSLASLLSVSDCQASSISHVRKENAHPPATRSSLGIDEKTSFTLASPLRTQGNLARWRSDEGLRFRSCSGPATCTHEQQYVPPPNRESDDDSHHGSNPPGLSAYGLAFDAKRNQRSTTPFKRWMSALRKRSVRLKKSSVHSTCSSLQPSEAKSAIWPDAPPDQLCRTSPSFTSSLGLLAAVKSASVTLGSTSAVFSVLSSRHSIQNGSSLDKEDGSMSNNSAAALSQDPQYLRIIQRWRILNELLVSEEEYLSCLKALSNFFFTILAGEPLVKPHRRLIQRIFFQLQDLHGELLVILDKELRPYSSRIMEDLTGRKRKKSLYKVELKLPENTVLAGKIARTFLSLCSQILFAYESFVSHLDFIQSLSSSVSTTNPEWHVYERGIEALSVPLSSLANRDSMRQKSLTMSDLLVKPIQRICKYVVIFEAFLDQLPACDHAESHGLVAHVLEKFRGVLREVNASRDEELTRELLRITWRLQKRLTPPSNFDVPPNFVSGLGKVLLCGVLFGSFEVTGKVEGRYFISILYRTHLILASIANHHHPTYQIDAILELRTCSLQERGSCHGLRYHECPCTWKLLVSADNQTFEILFSAESEKEENTWKVNLQEQIEAEKSSKWQILQDDKRRSAVSSRIFFPIQSLNHSKHLLRRLSLYYPSSASWFNKMSNRQVIIKQPASPALHETPPSGPVRRSISQSSRESISVLSPEQSERAMLERQIADVWTKTLLPFPSSSGRSVRNTTASVIQKLSISSFSISLSKRAASYGGASPNQSTGRSRAQAKEAGCSVPLRLVSESPRPLSSLGILDHVSPMSGDNLAPSTPKEAGTVRAGKRGSEFEARMSQCSFESGEYSHPDLRRSKSKPLKLYSASKSPILKEGSSEKTPPGSQITDGSPTIAPSPQFQLLRPSLTTSSPKRHHSMHWFGADGVKMGAASGSGIDPSRTLFQAVGSRIGSGSTSKLRLVHGPVMTLPVRHASGSDAVSADPLNHKTSGGGVTTNHPLSHSFTPEPVPDTERKTSCDGAPQRTVSTRSSRKTASTDAALSNGTSALPSAALHGTGSSAAVAAAAATPGNPLNGGRPKARIRAVPAVLDALMPKKFRRRPSQTQPQAKAPSAPSSGRKLSWLLR